MPFPFVNLCTGCPPEAECETDVYCGPNLPGTGIVTGDSIVVCIQKIDNVLFIMNGPYTTTTTTTIP